MKRWVAAIISPLVALIVGGCSSVVGGSAHVASGVVPNVIGMAQRDALQALSDAGSWPYVARSIPSDTVPPDRIVSIGPKPGTALPLNRVIDLVISTGPMQTSG